MDAMAQANFSEGIACGSWSSASQRSALAVPLLGSSFAAFLLLAFAAACPSAAIGQTETAIALERHYEEGELVAYRMQATNEGHVRNIRYEARVAGVVKKNAAGAFVEELAWSDVSVNGQAVTLDAASEQFRETLSLGPDFSLSIPDLSHVQPILIGPVTDLLAFYADVQLAMRQKTLEKPEDHVSVKHNVPNSWADGTYVVVGEDAVDFDITLKSVDKVAMTALLVVRHVPPREPAIQWPAAWMQAPVSDTANNWVEVEKTGDKYAAEVGKETFEADITVGLATGRILSAAMDNPVDVLQRNCSDRALTACGAPERYRIRRQIAIVAEEMGKDARPQAPSK
jgi:hypothetical protein